MTCFATIWLVATVGLIAPAGLPFRLTRKRVGAAALAILVLGVLTQVLHPLSSVSFEAFWFYRFDEFAVGLASRLAVGAQWREHLVGGLIHPVALSLLRLWALWFLR